MGMVSWSICRLGGRARGRGLVDVSWEGSLRFGIDIVWFMELCGSIGFGMEEEGGDDVFVLFWLLHD